MALQFEIRRSDANRQYFWRLWSKGNWKIIADSAETYVNKSDCRAMIDKIMTEAATAEVVDATLRTA